MGLCEGDGARLDGFAFGELFGGGADGGAAFGHLGGGFFVGEDDLGVVARVGGVGGERLAGQGEGNGGAEGEVGGDAHKDLVGHVGKVRVVLRVDGAAGVDLVVDSVSMCW